MKRELGKITRRWLKFDAYTYDAYFINVSVKPTPPTKINEHKLQSS